MISGRWSLAKSSATKYTHDEDLHGDGMLQHDHDIGLVLDDRWSTPKRSANVE